MANNKNNLVSDLPTSITRLNGLETHEFTGTKWINWIGTIGRVHKISRSGRFASKIVDNNNFCSNMIADCSSYRASTL